MKERDLKAVQSGSKRFYSGVEQQQVIAQPCRVGGRDCTATESKSKRSYSCAERKQEIIQLCGVGATHSSTRRGVKRFYGVASGNCTSTELK